MIATEETPMQDLHLREKQEVHFKWHTKKKIKISSKVEGK